jgi:hypothetical protein
VWQAFRFRLRVLPPAFISFSLRLGQILMDWLFCHFGGLDSKQALTGMKRLYDIFFRSKLTDDFRG